jgi:hypothetical protein
MIDWGASIVVLLAAQAAAGNKKADAVTRPWALNRVGLLFNGPPATCSGLPFI